MLDVTGENNAILTGVFIEGKTFQNLSVSSPAPVTIVCRKVEQNELHVAIGHYKLNYHQGGNVPGHLFNLPSDCKNT